MTDYSEQEMQAIAQVFPTAETHLCTFHREQAWLRWTKDGKNSLADREQGELLHLLRSIAWARTEESCLVAIENLRKGRIYQDSEKVRTYVEQWWISIKEDSILFRLRATQKVHQVS
ncbi:uncharacterized protein LOC143757405 isoform X1 [Siphateles boraxobius]|uniref:uncharacterized protein LOC143757405 isoform X1 n=1 Tax=Siphateles boraxobius TaxID=180520 RepID=UPI0040634A81